MATDTLPAYTKGENLLSLIDVLKKNNKNEDSIKAIFGKGKSAYDNTKSALRTFGIIEKDSFEFTEIGREIAFSDDENKKEEFAKIVKCYEPYKLILNSIEISKSDIEVTDIDTIKNLWGKAGFGSTDRNRNDGATLFMGLIDFIGFGNYLIGRNNNPTRIEWVADIKDKINSLFQESFEGELQKDDEKCETLSEMSEMNLDEKSINVKVDKKFNQQGSGMIMPNITINVDMGDWSEEKIKTFFKYVYGKFEEE